MIIQRRLRFNKIRQPERGQAHLPNLRGSPISSQDLGRKPFNRKIRTQLGSAQGWEGGLAPALPAQTAFN